MKSGSTKTTSSIFQGGKLKPGVYKIRNIVSQTYVDTKDHLRELCGRPPSALERGGGEWDIRPLGPGYTIRKAGPPTSAKPDQFCIMLNGIGNGHAVSVSDFPVAWKIQAVDDARYRGFEYVRIFWGSTNMVWDLAQWGSERDGTKVQVMDNNKPEPCRIWELVPVKIENFAAHASSSSAGPPRDFSPTPPYEENTGNRCCTCSHITTEPSDDGFGTTVIETTTVTTRKKYRRDD